MKITKCYWLSFVLLLCFSVLQSCTKILEEEPLGGAQKSGGRIAYTLTTPQVKPLPVVWQEEWNSGSTTPGDHTQHMQGVAYCESSPDRIYMGEDVSNVWVSRNFGLNWFTMKNEGLSAPFIMSVEVDPLDKNRVLVVANCRPYDVVNAPYQGIYLSTDGGITWRRRKQRQQLNAVRSSTKLLAYAPTSKNNTLGQATRWYAAMGESDDFSGDDGFLTSSDGGETWTEIRKLPAATYGSTIRGIKVHKTKAEKVFLYGNGGLFRFEDATDPNGAVTKISGRPVLPGYTVLPEGDIWGSIYQSDDGQTLIVAVSNQGIYKSTDAGANWSVLYSWNVVNYCYVNEKFPNMIFAVPTEGSAAQIQVSNNGGSSWTSPAKTDVHYRPGYDNSDWNRKLSGQFTYILPDPRDPSKVFIHTKSKNFRSTDGGLTWNTSDNGYNGAQHSGFGTQEQMFDPVNPDRFCYFMIDQGVNYTNTRGRWFYQNTVIPNQLGLSWKTSLAGALHPTEPVILACVGENNVGKLLRSPDNGQTWSVVSDGNKQRWVIAYDLQNPNYCYQWRERSTTGGQTWTELPNMPANTILAGVSRTNGSVLYAIDFKTTGKQIYRSTDRGDSWTLVINAGWNLTMPGDDPAFMFRVHPQNPNIVYTNSVNGHITKWDVSTLPAQATNITLPDGGDANFFIFRFVIDPRHPNVMYALNLRANTGNKFFRTVDGGATWENISQYITQGSVNGLAVSPVTGEVYISSQNGSVVMLPPYATSNTAYQVVPYTMNLLTAPYN